MSMQDTNSSPSERKMPASARKNFPQCPPRTGMPKTLEELFEALLGTVQYKGGGQYAWPWRGWESSKDARNALMHFECHLEGWPAQMTPKERLQAFQKGVTKRIKWVPFNGSVSNNGPMTLNACPGHAFVERVTNCGDANLELMALRHDPTKPFPPSPRTAVHVWFTKELESVVTDRRDTTPVLEGEDEDEEGDDETFQEELIDPLIIVRMFSSGSKDPKNNVLDALDSGVGLTAAEFPNTILSLNRGNKETKLYLTGKHGQGASSTYQYADLTIIASRKRGSKEIAFTIVELQWGAAGKVPTYRYLTVDGKIPTIEVTDERFGPGTLVRHVGYEGKFYNMHGENSVYGLLQRSLAKPLFPIQVKFHSMFAGTSEKAPTGVGAGDRRIVRGTVQTLEDAYAETLNPTPRRKKRPQEKAKVPIRKSEVFRLGSYDFDGSTGVEDMGQVVITYWAAERGVSKKTGKERSVRDVTRNWVVPEKPILFTMDGQTHAEESLRYITGNVQNGGANLWAVGRQMVVHIDCDGLSREAKYQMFTSTREALKITPIKTMILDELVRRLKFDDDLKRMNTQLVGGPKKSDPEKEDDATQKLKDYLKKSGIPLETVTRRIENWVEATEPLEVDDKGGKGPPPPIQSQEPPTFIRWKFRAEPAPMFPGQKYSWIFETDAPTSYWDPEDPSKSRIHVLANGVNYQGAGQMEGGRVRCHFQCPEDAKIGSRGMIQVQLQHRHGAAPASVSVLPIEVVARPEAKPKPPGGEPKPNKGDDKGNGGRKKIIQVPVRKKDFTEIKFPVIKPIPVVRTDAQWGLLDWPLDPSQVGFSIRSTESMIQLFYNAEFPTFLTFRRDLGRRGLDARLVDTYEMRLLLHTIFQLNHDYVDEDDWEGGEKSRKNLRSVLCATAESLLHAARTEVTFDDRVAQEEAAPVV